jgi:DNA helicase-2/ATP-dependent DNA helicase PcrA
MPEGDLLRLNHHAKRKTRPLLEVLRSLPGNEDLASVSGSAREAAARLLADLDRAVAEVPRRRTGEVLYGFLQWSGLLGRLARESSAEAEAKVKNIARFFETVKAYGDVAEHDRVPAFVEHLSLLREAGDDPAVAEADPDEDAVHVLTVHKAKGLEFPHVFLVGGAESKFPLQRRGEALSLPAALGKEELGGGGNGQLLEERRLFYVAMTRARDELVLTSASDYGAARARKVSRFVVEALDLPSPRPVSRKTAPLEALARNAPAPDPLPPTEAPIPEDELLRLSYGQIDDYETCPLKYRYVHVLRVPLLLHHAVVYGHAVHEAVRRHFEARLAGRPFTADDLVAAFRAAWVSEGFLSREHEDERRRAGEAMLRRFHEEEARAPWSPTAVEEEFAFALDRNRMQGRFDLVIEREGAVAIVDFKTGDVRDEKAAEKRAKESLQLDIYALAHLRTKGRLPDRVELRFLESGLVAGRRPSPEEAAHTEARIRAAAAAIRRRQFPAKPTWMACGQCPFREICPHTAWGEGEP